MIKNTTKKPLIIETSSEPIPASQLSKFIKYSTSSNQLTPTININNDNNDINTINTINTTTKHVNNTNYTNYTNNTNNNSNVNICNYDLEKEFQGLNCSSENYYSNECNKFLLKKEFIEEECLKEHENTNPYLYPSLSDKNFNIKIAVKKEFYDTKYDGTIRKNIKEYADELSRADFELQPHQAFVKNFLSSQTPYNSLLLYHSLGTGKTCSAIGVCEEMRDYMKQIGTTKRIIIVASENVQDNFKLQLFDERKLKLIDGIWSIKGCVGNKLLQEVNPMNMKGIPKDKLINQIKNLINTYYLFLGYGQFANYIIKTMDGSETGSEEINYNDIHKNVNKKKENIKKTNKKENTINKKTIRRLRNEFDNRLIVIDEVHNIRKTEDNENKKVAINLELLVKSAENMRFVLLSATPMYNSYKEIIWLLNLMNTNDRRGRIEVKDIFEKNGEFKKDGEDILIRKATGYISFVRGENPYTFPYRVYPNKFAPKNTFPFIPYPKYQMNLKKIKDSDKERILSLYLNIIKDCYSCGKCQGCVYNYIINSLRKKEFSITTKKGVVREMPNFENMESFGYTLLQLPLEALIITYPISGLKEILDSEPKESYSEELSEDFSEVKRKDDQEQEEKPELVDESMEEEESSEDTLVQVNKISNKNNINTENNIKIGGNNLFIDPHELTGKKGMERMMDFVDEKSPPEKGSYEYKKSTIQKYGKIFSRNQISNYSIKIKTILDNIYNPETNQVSDGIILIYSQYIDSGLIPMALALEEMGFTRYGENVKPLFKIPPTPVVDVRTMKEPSDKRNFMPARYSMITGDLRLSPNNEFEVKGLTNEDNKDGNKVKIVLISKAGSEGIDLKFIRQVHILDPWYNMNRIEQIIGRAVRNFSHKDLAFEKRNVEIFMHGTILENKKEEAADLYVYRVAEFKAIQIGKVTRVLKETSVDCIINHDQTNFTQENISAILNEPIQQKLSSGVILDDFKIGDEPFSPACDYMASCNYSCRPNKEINDYDLNEDTYNENFIVMNSEKIIQRIRMLMKESFFYKKDVLINAIQTPKKYPYVQIYSALTHLIDDSNEFIVDKYGRNGRLVNIDNYYLFQPIELKDKNISIFDRVVPIDYKHNMIQFEIKKNISNSNINKQNNLINNSLYVEEQGKEMKQFLQGKRVLDELNSNFEITREYIGLQKVPRGDDNWYKHCGIVIQNLSKEYPEMKEYLLEFLTAHMMEQLFFEDKLHLLNYLYSLDDITKNTIAWYAKEYFKRKIFISRRFKCIILYHLNKFKIMILNDENEWVESTHEDQREIASNKEIQNIFTFDSKNYNRYIGFIGYKKNNSALVFKTKDMDSKRDTGATCEESGKEKSIQKLNLILGEEKYTSKNTKLEKNEDGNVIREAIGQIELCILQEFILRYYDSIKKNEKKWFLTPEMAIYYKLYKIIV